MKAASDRLLSDVFGGECARSCLGHALKSFEIGNDTASSTPMA